MMMVMMMFDCTVTFEGDRQGGGAISSDNE
jgi:hypothetical protein